LVNLVLDTLSLVVTDIFCGRILHLPNRLNVEVLFGIVCFVCRTLLIIFAYVRHDTVNCLLLYFLQMFRFRRCKVSTTLSVSILELICQYEVVQALV